MVKRQKQKNKPQKTPKHNREDIRQRNGKGGMQRVEFIPFLVKGPHLWVGVPQVPGMTAAWQLFFGPCLSEL